MATFGRKALALWGPEAVPLQERAPLNIAAPYVLL